MTTPSPHIAHIAPYHPPKPGPPCDLRLDGNEGLAHTPALLDALATIDPNHVRLYPAIASLEAALIARHQLRDPAHLLVTAGADDALYRAAVALLGPERSLVYAAPTFEMIPRYASLTGATLRPVPWPLDAPYPADAICDAASSEDSLIAIVSPNNPTGQRVEIDTICHIARRCPHATVLLDLAYVEFDEHGDPTDSLLHDDHGLPDNLIIIRTLSKAWGMAGLRVGYALSTNAALIQWLRAAGNPYAVSAVSAHLATQRLLHDARAVAAHVVTARDERAQLNDRLRADLGATVSESHANFAFARLPHSDAEIVRQLFAGLGIAARAWGPQRAELRGAIRISCPGDPIAMQRVHDAFDALRPEAILFDMDGVMVDVSTSYRAAIIETAASFGVTVTGDDILRAKLAGDANNDWVLTRRLLASAGVEAALDEVTARFEHLYQGDSKTPGLWTTERALIDRGWLVAIKARTGARLAIVTGRPRADAQRHLGHHGIADLFELMVCMGEASRPKPDAAPVLKAMGALGVKTAWMLGDTPDDVRAARGACSPGQRAVVPIGVLAPSDEPERSAAALTAAGAACVLTHATHIDHLIVGAHNR
jgi:HAD superfamily hydrolase (TIGR01548 family)